jgi:hypothetical protein
VRWAFKFRIGSENYKSNRKTRKINSSRKSSNVLRKRKLQMQSRVLRKRLPK